MLPYGNTHDNLLALIFTQLRCTVAYNQGALDIVHLRQGQRQIKLSLLFLAAGLQRLTNFSTGLQLSMFTSVQQETRPRLMKGEHTRMQRLI